MLWKNRVMQALVRLWQYLGNLGQRHFTDPLDRKLNRVLNGLYALNLSGALLLNLVLAAILAYLLQQDHDRYAGYVFPIALPAIAHMIFTLFTLWLKNKTGSFWPALLSNIAYTVYMVVLCLYFGERAGVHLVLLMVMPTTFLFLRYGNWSHLLAHGAVMLGGLAAALVSYETTAPWFPMPPEITRLGGYLSWLAAISMLYVYSIYNWREVDSAERQLVDERDLNHRLLQETIPKLEKAEAKYRHLVDDSADLIFLTDPQFNILSMNRSSQKMLAFLPSDMVGRNLCDFVADGDNSSQQLSQKLLCEQVKQTLAPGKITRVRTRLIHKHREDGVEVVLSLQLSRVNGQDEIIARATEVEPEVTLRFLNREHGSYTLGNNILHADVLSQRIADRISLHYSQHELNSLRTCIREILINAIEHGNLGISFEEKSRVIEQGDFMDFLRQRQNDQRYANRKVQVRYVVNRTGLFLRITDEGDGFDHQGFLKRTESDDSLLMLEHGRGLTMARNAFDSVEFNAKGNQVTLKKKHSITATKAG